MMKKKRTNHEKYIELLNSPPKGDEKELFLWRKKVKELREKSNQDHRTWVKKIQEQWGEGEWDMIRSQLEKLSLEELCAITTSVGIKFTIGNENIKNKEEFLLVLDEAEKEELLLELEKYNLRLT